MAVHKIQVLATTLVTVEIDDAKVDAAFMAEFRQSFFQFHTLEEHAQHIAQLAARGIIDATGRDSNEFVEGYGPLEDAGIRYSKARVETEICGDR